LVSSAVYLHATQLAPTQVAAADSKQHLANERFKCYLTWLLHSPLQLGAF